MAFCIYSEFASGAINSGLLANAGKNVGERPSVGVVTDNIIDSKQRHIGCTCEFFHARQPRTIVPTIEHGSRQSYMARRSFAQAREQLRRTSGSNQFQSKDMGKQIIEMENAVALFGAKIACR